MGHRVLDMVHRTFNHKQAAPSCEWASGLNLTAPEKQLSNLFSLTTKSMSDLKSGLKPALPYLLSVSLQPSTKKVLPDVQHILAKPSGHSTTVVATFAFCCPLFRT